MLTGSAPALLLPRRERHDARALRPNAPSRDEMMTGSAVGTAILGVARLRRADARFASAITLTYVRLDICQT